MQDLIDAEATAVIGAGRYERTETRTTERNGSRPRLLTTHAGDIQLAVPKLRSGSFVPSILSSRRRIDQALYGVVMEAYVQGVSTRAVDDLVVALGGTCISNSEISRICAGLDETVGAFRTRRLEHTRLPYVYLDATYLHVRTQQAMVVSKAVVVATGVTDQGRREILGVDVGDSESNSEQLTGHSPERPVAGSLWRRRRQLVRRRRWALSSARLEPGKGSLNRSGIGGGRRCCSTWLRVAPRRVFKTWLAEGDQAWRDRVQIVAMDGRTGLKTGTIPSVTWGAPRNLFLISLTHSMPLFTGEGRRRQRRRSTIVSSSARGRWCGCGLLRACYSEQGRRSDG